MVLQCVLDAEPYREGRREHAIKEHYKKTEILWRKSSWRRWTTSWKYLMCDVFVGGIIDYRKSETIEVTKSFQPLSAPGYQFLWWFGNFHDEPTRVTEYYECVKIIFVMLRIVVRPTIASSWVIEWLGPCVSVGSEIAIVFSKASERCNFSWYNINRQWPWKY